MYNKDSRKAVHMQKLSNVNEAIVGGVYWVEKGYMLLETMGSQASDSIYHGVLACSPVQCGVKWLSGINKQYNVVHTNVRYVRSIM